MALRSVVQHHALFALVLVAVCLPQANAQGPGGYWYPGEGGTFSAPTQVRNVQPATQYQCSLNVSDLDDWYTRMGVGPLMQGGDAGWEWTYLYTTASPDPSLLGTASITNGTENTGTLTYTTPDFTGVEGWYAMVHFQATDENPIYLPVPPGTPVGTDPASPVMVTTFLPY